MGIVLDTDEKFKSHGVWYDIFVNNEKLGDMTCGIWSKRIKKNIGLCLVSVKLKSGEKVKVNKNGIEYTGTMSELPFI